MAIPGDFQEIFPKDRFPWHPAFSQMYSLNQFTVWAVSSPLLSFQWDLQAKSTKAVKAPSNQALEETLRASKNAELSWKWFSRVYFGIPEIATEQTELKRATGAAGQLKLHSSTSSAAPGSSRTTHTKRPQAQDQITREVSGIFQRAQVLHCLWDSKVL